MVIEATEEHGKMTGKAFIFHYFSVDSVDSVAKISL